MRIEGSIPGLTQWIKDPVLLRLWCRLAAAAQSQPMVRELPCAAGAALKKNFFLNRGEVNIQFPIFPIFKWFLQVQQGLLGGNDWLLKNEHFVSIFTYLSKG